MEKQAKIRHVKAHISSRLGPFGFDEGFPCIFHIVPSRLPHFIRTPLGKPGNTMNVTEKILRAFILRLLLLLLAVFAARHLPDHGLSATPGPSSEQAAAAPVDCYLDTLITDEASASISDMLLHD
jgi:hypothetical protein